MSPRRLVLLALVPALVLAGCADAPTADPTPGATPATAGATPPAGTPAAAASPPPASGEPLPATDAAPDDAGRVQPMLAGTYRARIETSMGTILVELDEEKAPLHVANFLQYAQEGLYDNTVFHRVAKGFVIQGGGFSAPFAGQESKRPTEWGPIPTEIGAGNEHLEGALGMARTSDPNSATSQWFINTARNSGLDAGYTVFGRVVEGLDVVKAIEQVPVGTRLGFQNVPNEDVVIVRVVVETPEAAPRPALASYTESVALAPGGVTSIPLLVKNVGGGRLAANFTASLRGSAGGEARLLHAPGALSPGQAGVAIVEVRAPATFGGGDLVVEATAGEASSAARVTVRKLDLSGNAAGPDHPRVSAYYVGIYDNGVVFDTTRTDLAARGFTLPGGFQEHAEPLKVFVGEGSGGGGYIPVIPGFASGIVGLHGGETRTVRLTSEEGYEDGYYRIFEMDVASVDS